MQLNDADFNRYLSGDDWKALVSDFVETDHCHHSEELINTYRTHSNHEFNGTNAMQTLRENFIQQAVDQGLRQGRDQGLQEALD